MTPLGFLPLKDAVDRASKEWDIAIDLAYERIRPLLWDGKIQSVATTHAGGRQELRDEWGASSNKRAHRDGQIAFEFYGKVINTLPAFVHESELDFVLKGEADTADATSTRAVQPPKKDDGKSKGGRPPKYSDHLFLIEAFRVLYETGSSKLPKSEAQFRQVVLQAFAARGAGTPSDDWARPLINLVLTEFGIDLEKPR